jgi:hypothetical protein
MVLDSGRINRRSNGVKRTLDLSFRSKTKLPIRGPRNWDDGRARARARARTVGLLIHLWRGTNGNSGWAQGWGQLGLVIGPTESAQAFRWRLCPSERPECWW